MMPQWVRIVDDDEAFCSSVAFIIRLVGLNAVEYESAESFLVRDDLSRPGCIVLDIRMPGRSGLVLQAELLERGLDLPILFLTGHGDVPTAVLAMKRGAADFLQKPVIPDLLQAPVKRLSAEHFALHTEKARLEALRSQWDELTPSEQETAVLLAEGLLNKIVADRMNIGLETVKNHRAHVFEKLRLMSTVELRDMMHAPGVIPPVNVLEKHPGG